MLTCCRLIKYILLGHQWAVDNILYNDSTMTNRSRYDITQELENGTMRSISPPPGAVVGLGKKELYSHAGESFRSVLGQRVHYGMRLGDKRAVCAANWGHYV